MFQALWNFLIRHKLTDWTEMSPAGSARVLGRILLQISVWGATTSLQDGASGAAAAGRMFVQVVVQPTDASAGFMCHESLVVSLVDAGSLAEKVWHPPSR